MRRSDDPAFRQFARSQAAPLRRAGYLLCGDWHLAEDLVQATLYKLYKAWPRIARTDNPVRDARRTLLRCWLDERRRPWRAVERGATVPDVADDTVDPAALHQRDATRNELVTAAAGDIYRGVNLTPDS